MRAFGLFAILALASVLSADPSAAEPKIGVAAAAKNQVQGIVGGGTRALSAGSDIFSNEVVRTGDESLAQLLFLDSTSLSVGARSEVKLDRFVYNPDRKTGNVVLEASRGAFRFVSGSQTPTNYTIKTPLATIGVRGTVVDGYITLRAVQVIVWQGYVVGTTYSGTPFELGPGQAILISANGQITKLQWDGTAFDNLFNTNYPLFGRQWELDPRFTSPPDSGRDLNDQLNAIDLRSLPTCIPFTGGARVRSSALPFCGGGGG